MHQKHYLIVIYHLQSYFQVYFQKLLRQREMILPELYVLPVRLLMRTL